MLGGVVRICGRTGAAAVLTSRAGPYAAVLPTICSKRKLGGPAPVCRAGEKANFAGADTFFTNSAKIIHATDTAPIPCYRLMAPDGSILNPDDDPNIPDETLKKWYRDMITLNVMDTILYDAQRQGRISFYMTSFGEEGTHIGTAAALGEDDVLYAQYRETGVLIHLGYPLSEFMNQCFGNDLGHGKGRQMPIHYGSKELNFHTISSPLGTQLPQASGAAYALKGTGRCVACYFGDGSASEGDAHPAFNFAATLECPVLFVCRNNGYAISTPVKEQYRGDGIASRAVGYGMDVIRVDGNDTLAVYVATKMARESAVEGNRPVLIEAMTYRQSHHSTSDDSSAYRSSEEMTDYATENAIERFHRYIVAKGIWSEEQETELRTSVRKDILKHFVAAEKEVMPSIVSLFDDVYAEIPPHLAEQKQEMLSHLAKYPEEYPTSGRAEN